MSVVPQQAFVRSLRSLNTSSVPQWRCIRASRFTAQSSNSRLQRRWRSDNHSAPDDDQVIPLSGYYADLIKQPDEKIQPQTRTAPTPPPADQLPKTDKEQQLQRARVVFGSRLAGPAERQRELDASSHEIAGILVPPKPTEPDNCCMSGCVNCVWDRFRDELEEWASKSAEARTRLQAQRASGSATGLMSQEPGMPGHVATSMDDDGGGSETNWNTGLEMSGEDGDLFGGIPVGIREFMRTEKLLKERHMAESSRGG